MGVLGMFFDIFGLFMASIFRKEMVGGILLVAVLYYLCKYLRKDFSVFKMIESMIASCLFWLGLCMMSFARDTDLLRGYSGFFFWLGVVIFCTVPFVNVIALVVARTGQEKSGKMEN